MSRLFVSRNNPYFRCDCDYYEYSGGRTSEEDRPLCDCGHLAEQHEDSSHACMMEEGAPYNSELHPLVRAAMEEQP